MGSVMTESAKKTGVELTVEMDDGVSMANGKRIWRTPCLVMAHAETDTSSFAGIVIDNPVVGSSIS